MERFRILIVDNDQGYRESLRQLLDLTYQVYEAGDSEDALQILKSELIHLVIIDVRLVNDSSPIDTSGLTLCDKIEPLIGRLINTGFTKDWHVVRTALDPAKKSQGLESADGFYSKEDKPDVLLKEIRRILTEKYQILPQGRLAVLTSGGEAPGMNAAIWSIVRTAMSNDFEVLGIQEGYQGLTEDRMDKLSWNGVSDIMAEGGTILQSARFPKFSEPSVREDAVNNIINKQVSGLIVIGGDGSMRGAMALANDLKALGRDLRTVAIPGTIDNDLWGTDMSLGAASAANSMVELVRNMIAPARALRRLFIVEVMGACCGYLAIEAGIGTGADAIVIPETVVKFGGTPVGMDDWKSTVDSSATLESVRVLAKDIARQLQGAFELGKTHGFIIFSEGVDLATRKTIASQGLATEFLNGSYLKGLVEEEIRNWTIATKPDVRVQTLGYPVRGVRPCSFDVWLGAALGQAAVNALIQKGETHIMVGWSEERGIIATSFEDVIATSNLPPNEVWKRRPKWQERLLLQQSLSQPSTFPNL